MISQARKDELLRTLDSVEADVRTIEDLLAEDASCLELLARIARAADGSTPPAAGSWPRLLPGASHASIPTTPNTRGTCSTRCAGMNDFTEPGMIPARIRTFYGYPARVSFGNVGRDDQEER